MSDTNKNNKSKEGKIVLLVTAVVSAVVCFCIMYWLMGLVF